MFLVCYHQLSIHDSLFCSVNGSLIFSKATLYHKIWGLLGSILLCAAGWLVCSDTFPLGCAFDESIVHHKYFEYNLDSKNSTYSTKNGIYLEGCGLDNVMISWGHDDYMYLVVKEHGTTLPPAALFII
ncbi:hypothetical protein CsSME_00051947 [Camellia sinensis var. sinensis]